jgi:DNA replication and repair protein RecF
MHFRSIKLYRYRNLEDQAVHLSPGLNLFFGPNGAGKTNLLEAFCAASGWGGFGRPSMIPRRGDGSPSPMSAAVAQASGEEEITCAFQFNRRPLLKIDGSAVTGSELRRRMPVLAFLPDSAALVDGPPSMRRRLLDMVCVLCVPGYGEALTRYRRAVRQRMASLRCGRWEEMTLRVMAREAVEIWRARSVVAPRLCQLSQAFASRLGIHLEASYVGQHESLDRLEPGRFLEAARSIKGEEMTHRRPRFGPHRDDVVLTSGGHAAGLALSRGQRRRAFAALVMASAQVVYKALRRGPVLVMDEVFAEVDREGRTLMARGLVELGVQVLASTADLPEAPEGASIYRVRSGVVTPVGG